MLPIFQYSNVYAATPKLRMLAESKELQQRCIKYVSKSGMVPLAEIHVRNLILTLRLLMSYIFMEHPFLMFLGHTQRRTTVGRTPLDK